MLTISGVAGSAPCGTWGMPLITLAHWDILRQSTVGDFLGPPDINGLAGSDSDDGHPRPPP